jgi:hypothetical protein
MNQPAVPLDGDAAGFPLPELSIERLVHYIFYYTIIRHAGERDAFGSVPGVPAKIPAVAVDASSRGTPHPQRHHRSPQRHHRALNVITGLDPVICLRTARWPGGARP